jgi:hypothetical protein
MKNCVAGCFMLLSFLAKCLCSFRKVCGMFVFRPRRGNELACWRFQASSAEAAFGAWLLVGLATF